MEIEFVEGSSFEYPVVIQRSEVANSILGGVLTITEKKPITRAEAEKYANDLAVYLLDSAITHDTKGKR